MGVPANQSQYLSGRPSPAKRWGKVVWMPSPSYGAASAVVRASAAAGIRLAQTLSRMNVACTRVVNSFAQSGYASR